MAICLRARYERTFRPLCSRCFPRKSPLHMHAVGRRCDLPAVVGFRGLQWTLPRSPQDQRRALPSSQKEGWRQSRLGLLLTSMKEKDIALGIVHVNALVCFSILRLTLWPAKLQLHTIITGFSLAALPCNSSDLYFFLSSLALWPMHDTFL